MASDVGVLEAAVGVPDRQQPRADRYERTEAALRWPMLALALGMLVVLLADAMPRLSPTTRSALTVSDLTIWAAFAAEYLLLLALAPSRRHYIRTHWLELALVVIPLLRPLRFIQVARQIRLARVGGAFGVAVKESRATLAQRGVIYVAGITVTLMLVCAALMVDLERGHPGANITSLGTALWWASVTVTTIGYGDHYPVTAAGRMVAVVLSASGIALVGVITAAVAAWFVRSEERTIENEIETELQTETIEQNEATQDIAALHRRLDDLTNAVGRLAATLAGPGPQLTGDIDLRTVAGMPDSVTSPTHPL